MSFKKLVLVALISAVSPSLYAADRYVLQLGDAQFTRATAIGLKSLLQRQHGVNARSLELRQVAVVAKSNFGRATAALQVGNAATNAIRIHGSPADFRSNRPVSFDRLNFVSPARKSAGVPWKLVVNGRVKVRKIVVTVEQDRRNDRDNDDRRKRRLPRRP